MTDSTSWLALTRSTISTKVTCHYRSPTPLDFPLPLHTDRQTDTHTFKILMYWWCHGSESVIAILSLSSLNDFVGSCGLERCVRGSHIRVAYRSICNLESSDQHGSNQGIKTNSERLISIDRHTFLDTKEAWLHFVLWTPVKSSDQEPRNGAIKRSRMIFTDQNSWSRSQTLLQVTRMWLPLVPELSAINYGGELLFDRAGKWRSLQAGCLTARGSVDGM